MEDHAVVFLTGTGEEAGDVDEGHQRNVEGIAEADKAGTLARCVAVKHTGEIFGLVGNYADCLAVETGKADDDIFCVFALDFKEFAVVDDCVDDLIHVIGMVGRVRHDLVQRVFQTVNGVVAFNQRRFFEVVLGDVAEELADDAQGLFAVFGCEVCHTALLRVHGCAAECFLGHVFASHGLDHLRAGEEHVADALGHDGEVSQRGRIHRTAGAGAEDAGDLGNHA